MIMSEADLDAAIAAKDPYLWITSGSVITLSGAKVLDYPCTVHGGHLAVDDGPAFLIASSGVTVTGVRIDGGKVGNPLYSAGQKLIYACGTAQQPLTGMVVSGCRLTASRSDNVWLQWVTDSLVVDNHITNYLYSGVMGVSCQRVHVGNNIVRDSPLQLGTGMPVNCYGIAFTDVANTEQARSRDCSIVGNQVSLVDWEGIDTHGGDGITIVGNQVTACPRGIALVTGNDTRVTSPTRQTVTGNNINGAGCRQPARTGIWLAGIANVPASGTIVGNHIDGYPDGQAFGPVNFVDRAATMIAVNSSAFQPWTLITMGPDFTGHADYPPMYMIDGNTVYLRGMVIPKAGTAKKIIGKIPNAHAYPASLSFVGTAISSNPPGSQFDVGVWGPDGGSTPSGTLQAFYSDAPATGGPAYGLQGSYSAI